MSSAALNAHEKKADSISKWVWYESNAALSEGEGVCYNFDYGTASAEDARRYNRVETPSITNAQFFAGVAARAYSAVSSGQMIEIYVPGSVCNVYSKASTTVGVGRITCTAAGDGTVGEVGAFQFQGFPGRGSAIPLQTVDRSGAAGSTEAPGSCLAYLEDGEESGLVQILLAVDNAAITPMVGGVTVFKTAVTLTNGNSTCTLADGTKNGLRKAFWCDAAMTTSQVVITVTSGIQGVANNSPTTALATISLNAANEEISLRWDGFDSAGLWVPSHYVGADLA